MSAVAHVTILHHVSLSCSPFSKLPQRPAPHLSLNNSYLCLQISSILGSTSFARKPLSESPLNHMMTAYCSSKAALNMQVGSGLMQQQVLSNIPCAQWGLVLPAGHQLQCMCIAQNGQH